VRVTPGLRAQDGDTGVGGGVPVGIEASSRNRLLPAPGAAGECGVVLDADAGQRCDLAAA
jgi:hypothetical protein